MSQISPQNNKVYILDTSILIGFANWLPFKYHKQFWDKITIALENGQWVLLDIVVNEITYPKELKDWCSDQRKKGLVKKIDQADQNRGIAINNQYPMIDPTSFKSENDTYIIAYAERNNLKIISAESSKKPLDKLFKIPDTCYLLGVESTRKIEYFLADIKYTP